MQGHTVQILAHMYSRSLSIKSGVIIGCSNSRGKLLAEQLAELTKEDIESALEDNGNPVTNCMALFTNMIETSCRALGHTPEAAKLACKGSFSMLEHIGTSSVFLTVSPSDECSF